MSDLNPTWEDCPCGWGRAAWEEGLARQERMKELDPSCDPYKYGVGYEPIEWGEIAHDNLLGLEGPHPWQAFTSLTAWLMDCTVPNDRDLTVIFAQHNWRDPVGITDLAFWLECELDQSRKACRRESRGALSVPA